MLYPEYAKCISMALTPMVLTGRLIKKKHPGCKVVFIGPCSAKKLEASRADIRSDVDFVLTFEEVMGMFEAKEIDFTQITGADNLSGSSADGRGFAVSGGVVVTNCYRNKTEFPGCRNVLMGELELESMMETMQRGVKLACSDEERARNYAEMTIPRNWPDTLKETLEKMGECL